MEFIGAGGGGGSGDEQETQRGRKTYIRHTSEQTAKLEAMFAESPHPDEGQRRKLARELGLEPKQVKFWFQNKRTQMKTQTERADNNALRAENQKIQRENFIIREALKKIICRSCRGPNQDDDTLKQLRLENARLKAEHERVSAILARYMNGPIPEVQLEGGPATGSSSLVTESTPVESATMINSNGDTLVPNRPIPTLNKAIMPQIATSAKDEFLKVLCTDQPLWVKSSTDPTFSLQRDHYEMLFPRSTDLFPNSNSLAEASKASRTVKRKAMELVDLFLDTEKWSNLFPTIVREADTIQVIAKGSEENRSGTLLLMHAEMHVLSPLVQSREFCFLRYCEELEAGTWVIVDVSIDYKKEGMAFPPCTWRLPSGCMIQEISNGSSQVSWLEHVEVDAKIKAHQLYRDLVNRGIAFGAERWLMELERMCERFTSAEIDYIPTNDTGAVVAATGGRRSMMKLSHKVVKSFFGILNMSNKMEFPQHLADENSNIRISVRKNADPSRPNAMMIITAATSFRLPLPPQTLFDFFRDTTKRSKWDALSCANPVQELARISTGTHPSHYISIIRPVQPAATSNVWIVQESFSDPLVSYVIYSPVNVADLQKSVNGIDSPTVPVIPSGVLISKDEESIANEGTNADKGITRGSLLTLAFQILMDNPATMNLESVTSVNSLIASVVGSIKVALLNGPNLEV